MLAVKKWNRFAPWPNLVVIVAGGVSAAVGLGALVASYTDTADLVRMLPAFMPMQYGTALGFLLCGVGLLALVFGRPRLALACGAVAAALGLLTLIEYVFGADLAINRLLTQRFMAVETTQSGRMAPNTALSFILSGAALVVLSGAARARRRPLIAGLLGFLIIVLGLGAFLGYLGGVESAYGWRDLTRIAVHTGTGFAVLGAGVFATAWRKDAGKERGAPLWITIPVGLSVVTLAVALWQALIVQERVQIERIILAQANSLRSEIKELVEPRILALVRMAKRWEVRGRTPRAEWESDAKLILAHQPGFQAIEWVDPSFRVRWIVPAERNRADRDLDLAFDGRRRATLEKARDRRQVTVTRSVSLAQGGKGFLVYVPVFAAGELDGFMLGVFSLRKLLDTILKDRAPGYAITVLDGAGKIYNRNARGGRPEAGWVKETKIDLHGLTWRLRLSPGSELLAKAQSPLPKVALAVALLLAFLLTLTVHLAQMTRLRAIQTEGANRKLENEIAERKRAEAMIRSLNAELEKRVIQVDAANQELEAFTYSVSHDLRAPLRAMDGFSRVLLEDYADKLDAEGKDSLKRICAASKNLGRLVDDLLQLSRTGRAELQREMVDLSKLAWATSVELQKTSPEREVTFDIAPGVVAKGDPRLLSIVLENLLGNAWKFTSRHPEARIEFGETEEDGKPVYYVRDDGAGFDMAYADKLFKPFQRLHSSGKFEGSGIGLATVARIVRRHSGRIWAHAAVEKGTTVYFTL
ncbi:MAG: ATP-binding protein [Alphaproteobacteria bacterium]